MALTAQTLIFGVSIHAPREGCDSYVVYYARIHSRFQFTHPGRGATGKRASSTHNESVSIHAPREGCDITDI